jgi:suppressor for copper-sensitivity B
MFRSGYRVAALAAICSAFVSVAPGPAGAADSGWQRNERVAVRLVSATNAVGTGYRIDLGIEIVLAPGWKTYWRSPGQSGYPPGIGFGGSTNLAEAVVEWPRPERFELNGMPSVGYGGRVILPVRALLSSPGERADLRMALRLAVCREICVLEDMNFELRLPAGAAEASPSAADVAEFRARVPVPGAAHSWTLNFVRLARTAQGSRLVAHFSAGEDPFRRPDMLAEGDAGDRFGPPRRYIDETRRELRFEIPYFPSAEGAAPKRPSRLVLTVLDHDKAGEFAVPDDAWRR